MQKIDVPEMNMPRVVIIGGGFGGLELVKGLKNKDFQVVLLDRNNYHTFQPLLYQVATAGLEPDSIAFPIRKIFKKYKNFHFRLAEVERVDPELKQIYTNIGQLHFDYLVIATGSKTNFFGNNDLKMFGMPLKTVTQALDLRSMMLQNFEKALLISDITERESTINFVIVGGGPTGVELAGAMGELKKHVLPNDYPEIDVRRMQIHLIEAGPKLLPGLSEKSSDKSMEYLKKLGVHVWSNTMVTGYDGQTVSTNTGKSLNAKNLVWSAGVMGNSVDGFSIEKVNRSGRILVNTFNQVEGYKDIFAIGDVASMEVENYPNGHPMVAPVAMQQGSLLAKNLLKLENNKEIDAFEYNDKGSMATIGRNKAVVEIAKMKWSGAFAWFVWMFVHLISLVGFRNKTIVLVNWLWNYFNYDRGIRLIIRPFKRNSKDKEQLSNVV